MGERAISVLESMDGFADLRNAVRDIAARRGDWAGIPMPLEGLPLVVEPKWPDAEEFMKIGMPEEKPGDAEGCKFRNSFIIRSKQQEVYIWEEDGKINWGRLTTANRLSMDMSVLGAADAWGIEQEHNALMLLCDLILHRQFKQYFLTGCFLEQSKRSGVHYFFRRLRPTVAIRSDDKDSRILAALCMHPIGYYRGSWAGAMTPTDDVVAHLALMRADEHMFWRRCNQHPPWSREAGL